MILIIFIIYILILIILLGIFVYFHFKNTFLLHKHLQDAKNVLVNALSSHQTFHHTVNGQQVKPEGHVAVINNRPTKLVDRSEFSRLNFAARA